MTGAPAKVASILAAKGPPSRPRPPPPTRRTLLARGVGTSFAALGLAGLTCLGGLSGLLGGCTTTTEGGVPIDIRHASRGQDSRVMFLILHYTVADRAQSIRVLTEGEVSAHYLVTDEAPPRILRLVPEERRAWHSGQSGWKGHRMLNAGSIGIEIVHPGFRLAPDGERIYLPFPEAQIEALIPLVRDIVQRHQIRPERILGHGEVTPSYKEDPGPLFPWRRLAELGITPPWPDAAEVAAQRAIFEARAADPLAGLPDARWFQDLLAAHGYPVEKTGQLDAQTRRVLMNFQMRYRPARHDGLPDAECAAILWVLNVGASATQPGLGPAADLLSLLVQRK